MHHARYLLFFFLFWTSIYSGFRGFTYWYNFEKTTEATRLGLADAFLLGFRFDWQVASYSLIMPFLWLSIAYFRGSISAWEGRFLRIYFWSVSLVILAICAADVPYFSFFNSRITTAALLWKDTPGQIVAFVFGSPEYYPFLLTTVFGGWCLVWLIRFSWKTFPPIVETKTTSRIAPIFTKTFFSVLLTTLLVLGMRGGWQRVPLILRDSFQSNDGFLNQLSTNPVHSWFDSFRIFNVNFMSDEEAVARTRASLGIMADSIGYDSPIARFQKTETAQSRPLNVVLLLVESLSAERLAAFGNLQKPMPFLDSLAGKSLFFKNLYSAGIHTSNGLAGTLYSQPALFGVHPMSNAGSAGQHFAGIPTTLKKAGYCSVFFTTSDRAFDNMGFFLSGNGFDRISDKYDYPPELWLNNWGVSDKSLLTHSLQVLDSLGQDPQRPFFATLLTISTHPPYELPPDMGNCPITPGPVSEQVWQYTDCCLRYFFGECAKKPWFQNTVFVVLGDHGWLPSGGSPFDVAMPFNHVPCMFFAPGIIAPEARLDMASQMDLYPTLMHLLGIGFTNNTLGINLFEEKRPFAVFSQDSKIGVANERYLYVMRKSGSTALYDYGSGSNTDIQKELPELADSMRFYGASMLQTGQWLLNKRLVGEARRMGTY